ncbi:MAG: ATP-binding protein [Spirochaetales bacterium]|nr:ATP-binding protein [Spirochaetales bacterium]
MQDILNRPIYMKKITPFIGREMIKVIVGQRRVGKSCLLLKLIEKIKNEKPRANIIYIDKDDRDFNVIKNDEDLYTYVSSKIRKKASSFLFIDEVQEIDKFEYALRSLNKIKGLDIYITGSNANILFGDLSTLLAGRSMEFQVHGLTYREFLKFHSLEDSDHSAQLYTMYGGLPYLRHLELDDEIIYDFLKNIYQTILYRDVVSRNRIRNTLLLERLVLYLADSLGSIISAKKISDFLKSQRINMSVKNIPQYLNYLAAACFIHKTPRYDIQGKRNFKINEKYYFEDLGLRAAIAGYKSEDIKKILENIVHNHLLFAGYTVKVGKLKNLEIDFVAEKQGRKQYYQVCYLIPDEKVAEREFGNLEKIPDQYPKFVISMDTMMKGERNGIRHLTVRDFLLQT